MATKTAGSINLTTAVEAFFDSSVDRIKCTTLWVRNSDASAGTVHVRVRGLHKAGEFLPLPIGVGLALRLGSDDIEYAEAKADSTGTLEFGVIAALTKQS